MQFTRINTTIPAAGNFDEHRAAGVAILVEAAANYKDPATIPTIHFGDTNDPGRPIYPGNVISAEVEFRRFYIQGTAESAGSEIWLQVFPDLCSLELTRFSDENVNIGATEAGATFEQSSTDVAQALTSAQYTLDGVIASAMTVTAENNPIRYAFGGTAPDQTDLGHLLAAGESVRILGGDFVTTFQYISANNAAAAAVNFTMEF